MLTDTAAIRTYFGKMGFEPEIADIYLALHANGPQTISELSRTSKVERTRIYRLIDKLLESSLIELESHYKRGVIRAAPIANLSIVISQKEQELKSLQDELGLIEQVLARNSLSSPVSRVQFYHGSSGFKQMLWNECKAKTEVRSIVHKVVQPDTGKVFFDRFALACNENGVQFREIHGKEFLESHKTWYTQNDNTRLAFYQARLITDDVFKITHSLSIYNDVVAHYNWKDGEIFGVEIYNKDIAHSQGQFFEMLWDKSTPEARADRYKS